MELNIERFSDSGEGIGKFNGKVIFIPKTIPGDVVLVKDISNYSNYSRATVDKFIVNSPSRCSIKCPYYELCGGCQIMGLDYNMQLEYKKNKVINILKKFGDVSVNPYIVGTSLYGYRNKIILEVFNGKLGLFKYKSHDIVNIDKCLLVSDYMNKIIKIINNKINLSNADKVMLRKSTTDDVMVCFYGDVNNNEVINNLKDYVKSIYVNDNLIFGDKRIFSILNNYSFGISLNSFFQVNYDGLIKIYDKVLEYIDVGDRVLDLYCGSGSIGIYVSSKCSEILGIEINSSAIFDAILNKENNKVDNISFKCGNVSDIINDTYRYDTVIIDPPRGGLNKKTIDILLNMESNKIIYVSCNAITLARDIKSLGSKYYLKDISLVDMFPNTYHVETVTLLERK